MSSLQDSDLKLFGMNNLMLESALAKLEKDFENKGIKLDHIQTLSEENVVDLELFDLDIRKNAQKMSDFYMLYFCLENTIRRMIQGTLSEKYGLDWWDKKVPQSVKDKVKEKKDKEKDSVLSMRSDDLLSYTNFGELIEIFEGNWVDFQDVLRSKKPVKQTLSQFNEIRNVIAHSCVLNDDDILRLNLLIKDWLRLHM